MLFSGRSMIAGTATSMASKAPWRSNLEVVLAWYSTTLVCSIPNYTKICLQTIKFWQKQPFKFIFLVKMISRILARPGTATWGTRKPYHFYWCLIFEYSLVSRSGFIPDSLDLFIGKTGSGDYHSEMNGDHYADYIKERLAPNLPDKTVLIIDKASYHCVMTGF